MLFLVDFTSLRWFVPFLGYVVLMFPIYMGRVVMAPRFLNEREV